MKKSERPRKQVSMYVDAEMWDQVKALVHPTPISRVVDMYFEFMLRSIDTPMKKMFDDMLDSEIQERMKQKKRKG